MVADLDTNSGTFLNHAVSAGGKKAKVASQTNELKREQCQSSPLWTIYSICLLGGQEAPYTSHLAQTTNS